MKRSSPCINLSRKLDPVILPKISKGVRANIYVIDSLSVIPEEMRSIINRFSAMAIKELPDGLPPMKQIQHCIDLISGVSLLNFHHHRMICKKCKELHGQVSNCGLGFHSGKSKFTLLIPKKDGTRENVLIAMS